MSSRNSFGAFSLQKKEKIMSEIREAVQIIRVGYDSVEIVMKVGSASLKGMKNVIDFMVALLEREKTLGKTSMKKLLLKGGICSSNI